jgi:tetratricopeptide (TPR) repeat protein
MAYGELAHIQMLAGAYAEAIANAQTAIDVTERSPAFVAGHDWPTFSSTHKAFALASLGRYVEAMIPLERSLEYWVRRANDAPVFQ